jgi:hypothetical protein
MIRAPAHAHLQPPLAHALAALHVPHPARAPERDDRDAAAGDEHRRGGLAAPDRAHVRHGQRAAAARHLLRRQRAGDLPAEVGEVRDARCERVDGGGLGGGEGRRVEPGRRRKRERDVRRRAEGHGRFGWRGGGGGGWGGCDGGAEDGPFHHCPGEGLDEDGEVGEASVAACVGDVWWRRRWVEGTGRHELRPRRD